MNPTERNALQAIANDADWAEVTDELNVELRARH